MEWKVIVGQVCVTAIAISLIAADIDSGLLYLSIGGLLASIGYPYITKKETP